MNKKQKSVVWPGDPYPLGATWDGEGVNFAIFSENAEKVELCLFDESGKNEIEKIEIGEHTDQVFHCYLPHGRLGQLYGYRIYGPYKPDEGHRFNPNKLLLDPYAKATVGEYDWDYIHFGYKDPEDDESFDKQDNAPGTPKCRVVDTAFTWGDDRPPKTPWHDTVIYELHVKGFTKLHPTVPPELRGTYAGLVSPPAIEHLQRLGITAVELMPVHLFVDDKHLLDSGLKNYWGYNSIGFLTPDMRYSATGSISEFKTMVKRLHRAGLEVILDVVYNHTAEGNHLGPTLSFRGIDNAAYYRLMDDDKHHYMDYTGTGNTLNMMHPRVLQLIMDSLRYWILEMHVDGFRFDLASALARELHDVDKLSAFFDIIRQDPVISQVKLIAEPWDVGEGGYQVGNFPVGWTEWNGKYRDEVRSYWKGDGGLVGELAYRLTGSSDLYEHDGRRPHASVNFVTAHDGFTLSDLVSYNEKHNEENGEGNNDGESHNDSWNCGEEGPTERRDVRRLRAKQKRNFMATLLLSQGVPMILHGDETGRTQYGNNNVYCQDNETSWMEWNLAPPDRAFLEFTRRVIRLRKEHPAFRRRRFFQGRKLTGTDVKDITWLAPEGREMTDEEWSNSFARSLGLQIAGFLEGRLDAEGRPEYDDDFILLLNAHHEDVPFILPEVPEDARWEAVIDTAYSSGLKSAGFFKPGDEYPLKARSMAVLTNALRVSIEGEDE
ncbi:MAG: glycogen debranching protein GlgX [Rubrobacter sp.]|jgi:glycogen operon protein|nr:glycogen debranching protein GlgX [Rubrobacter sp.]